MAVSLTENATARTSSTVNASSYSTASITPTANQPIYVFVESTGTTNVPTLTVYPTGIGTPTQENTVATGARTVTLFTFPGGASPGASVFTADFAGGAQTGCIIHVIQGSGIDTTTNNGIVQSATNTAGTGTSLTITLSAFAASGNVTLSGIFHATNETTTSDSTPSAYTQFADSHYNTPTSSFMSQWLNANDTTSSASWATSTSNCGIAVEIKELVAGDKVPWTPTPQLGPIQAQ